MAMISCSKCGGQISDRAKKCVHCGYVFEEVAAVEPRKCSECGAEMAEGESVCSNCGCPVDEEKDLDNLQESFSTNEQESQHVDVAEDNFESKKIVKKIVLVIAVVLLLLAGVSVMNVVKENKSEQYGQKLAEAAYQMIVGAADAEECGNLILSVWYNCIFEESDAETDKYTHNAAGFYYDDFNDALSALFEDTNFQGSINKIQENQSTVVSLMKEVKNPPDEWEDAYDDLKSLYDEYATFTNLVISPTGSYSSFYEDFSSADNDTVSAYKKMELHFN